jgi:DNA-binding response OmpR family regulator
MRTAEAGFDAHVVKPVDPVALENLVDSLLRMKHRT